ncbi:ROK family protein [Microbacteriaceae bacterium 4G12]
MTRVHAGIDVGGTTTHVVLTDETFSPVGFASTATPALAGGDAILAAATTLLSGLLDGSGAGNRGENRNRDGNRAGNDYELVSVGLGTAGVVDTLAGTILVVSDSFAGWAGHPVRSVLESRYAVPVAVENDVNAFLVGEMYAGAGVGSTHALGITLGTGVGGALWLDGALYTGPGGAAGEIGHTPGYGSRPCTCGGHGHLETLAAGRSISRLYRERTGRSLEASAVSAAALAGDPDARKIFATLGEALAQAVSVTTGLLDIDTVVIGGGVTNGWDSFAPTVFHSLAVEPPVRGHSPRVVKALLGDSSVAIGSAIIGAGSRQPAARIGG